MMTGGYSKPNETDIFLFYDSNLYNLSCQERKHDCERFVIPILFDDPWGIGLEECEAWKRFKQLLLRLQASPCRLFITVDHCGDEIAYLAKTLNLLSNESTEIYLRTLLRQQRYGYSVHFAEGESPGSLIHPELFNLLNNSEKENFVLQWIQIENKRDSHPIFLNGQLYPASDGFLDPLISDLVGKKNIIDGEKAIDLLTQEICVLRYGFNDDYVRRQVERWIRRNEVQ